VSDPDDLAAWLRAAVEARLQLAREASPHTDGHWWRRTTDLLDGGPPEPVGHLYAGEQIFDDDGEVFGGECIVVYDEGAPSGWQFDHIAANDPRDTIARCEAELAILGEYEAARKAMGEARDSPGGVGAGVWACVKSLSRAVELLGHGYRFRDGYRREWRP
jgi:hypothetical protein